MQVSFKLNGKPVTLEVKPNEVFTDVLRYKLGVKSVKRGCERAECGACTVLLDGKPVYSCMLLAPQVNGREVITLEHLIETGEVKPILDAFAEVGAVQCGFCSPGFVLTAYAYLKTHPNPTREELKKAIEGNLCRCTGYKKILDALELASKKMH